MVKKRNFSSSGSPNLSLYVSTVPGFWVPKETMSENDACPQSLTWAHDSTRILGPTDLRLLLNVEPKIMKVQLATIFHIWRGHLHLQASIVRQQFFYVLLSLCQAVIVFQNYGCSVAYRERCHGFSALKSEKTYQKRKSTIEILFM